MQCCSQILVDLRSSRQTCSGILCMNNHEIHHCRYSEGNEAGSRWWSSIKITLDEEQKISLLSLPIHKHVLALAAMGQAETRAINNLAPFGYSLAEAKPPVVVVASRWQYRQIHVHALLLSFIQLMRSYMQSYICMQKVRGRLSDLSPVTS